jgi:hypothetical protein
MVKTKDTESKIKFDFLYQKVIRFFIFRELATILNVVTARYAQNVTFVE